MNCNILRNLILTCLAFTLLTTGWNALAAPQQSPVPSKKIIRIGLIPEQNIFEQKKRYEPLLDYLSDRFGASFEIVMLSRYGNIIDNFNSLKLDGAFFGSFTGAMAIKKLGVEPLARPLYVGGASTYYGMVFVRKDSGIKSAADMKGKRMVFVDKATTAGYLLPLSYFKSIGIDNYRSWFSETYFSGTHEDAIKDVLNRVADVGAAKNTIFYHLALEDKRVMQDLEILTVSPHVPSNGLAVRKDFSPEFKTKLHDVLLQMHKSEKGRSVLAELKIEKFINTTADDYKPVMDYAKTIGLDLAKYKYLNN